MGMKELESTKENRDEDGNDFKGEQACRLLAEFILETENRLGRETWSDMNTIKNEFPVANL